MYIPFEDDAGQYRLRSFHLDETGGVEMLLFQSRATCPLPRQTAMAHGDEIVQRAVNCPRLR
jgi:hypothetical protein